jgi:hypothetical protein|tara:strand:- start:27 stop:305 length:279 start_codon:yes stop_codon:yes gene_type:complete
MGLETSLLGRFLLVEEEVEESGSILIPVGVIDDRELWGYGVVRGISEDCDLYKRDRVGVGDRVVYRKTMSPEYLDGFILMQESTVVGVIEGA